MRILRLQVMTHLTYCLKFVLYSSTVIDVKKKLIVIFDFDCNPNFDKESFYPYMYRFTMRVGDIVSNGLVLRYRPEF